ncbi:Zinc/iron permease [Lentinus tigrinus ALCF2SS1-7]|uniref:Zinc/iron permease n=1 Tax=Lentinus tigrinus ALCF2SS1-6 TaxID=1328759 RepID=A0A5C2S3L3_9APHY|nr:Zinc/iron permease [Lentinus tigrinus ALCF2SS1-6]RPD72989.1 Zinc/iron permease [Lentinus tigrinus ALCF2SS1-7]
MPQLGLYAENVLGKLPQAVLAVDDDETMDRVLIMLLIFTVSLFAVSFPTITAMFRSIRVPSILFFIGKHFGTGVILSTAFVHLLQDAFKALQDPIVNERWKVGHWAGMIVLCSLLSIFLVEYVSTAFVDRLQSYSSAPSTPTVSSASSMHMAFDSSTEIRPSVLVESPSGTPTWLEGLPRQRHSERPAALFDESGHPSGAPLPLAPPELADEASQPPQPPNALEASPLIPPAPPSQYYGSTSQRSSSRPPARPSNHLVHISAPPGDTFFSGGHHRHESRNDHAKHHARVSRWGWFPWSGWGSEASSVTVADHAHSHSHSHSHGHAPSRTHSHSDAPLPPPRRPPPTPVKKNGENGHAHSSRSHHHAHAHVDMERWMHGIDGEDHANGHGHECGHMHDVSVDEECATECGDAEETKVGRRRQVIGILVLQLGIMIHSLVIGLTLSITSGSEFTSLVIAIFFHQLFEGLSLGIRIAGLPTRDSEHGFHILPGRTLKPLLATAFAITTPLGIGIGLATLSGVKTKGPHLILVQGVMSAISAGMLIYAACVEMLAGDFVMDAHLWRSSVHRQALALGSLFAGVLAMAAIGSLD